MNSKTERWEKINFANRFLKDKEMSHMNCIRLTASPTSSGKPRMDKHNRKMVDICLEYLDLGIPFLTEARFSAGGRPDILLPLTMEVIEVINTESPERLERKKFSYPTVFKIKKVYCDENHE